jgi:hypothetical protein
MASTLEFDTADLERQIRALGGELAELRRSVVERGTELYGDVGDAAANYYAQLTDRVSSNFPALRRRAVSLEKSIYDHPALAGTIGLVVVALIATLWLRGRSATAPTPKGRKRAR